MPRFLLRFLDLPTRSVSRGSGRSLSVAPARLLNLSRFHSRLAHAPFLSPTLRSSAAGRSLRCDCAVLLNLQGRGPNLACCHGARTPPPLPPAPSRRLCSYFSLLQ
ncbi:unnamed protein product [Nesidiocoris tenuis]|nr:unnamed protein product [Nesidiocoris tenuis]